MRIIAQKSNNLNTYDFFYNGLTKNYIDAISFNITYTKDNRIVVFNNTAAVNAAVTNTINNSTLGELSGYEVVLLEDILKTLNNQSIKKQIYIDLIPSNTVLLTNENIEQVTSSMNDYIDAVYKIIERYPNLTIKLHSINRNLTAIMKQKIKNHNIGYAITGEDSTFIDVDYYIIAVSVLDNNIVNMLLKRNKEVIIYIYSDYYISYLYEHYVGEKSTPELQAMFQKLGLMSNYPDIINKMFSN